VKFKIEIIADRPIGTLQRKKEEKRKKKKKDECKPVRMDWSMRSVVDRISRRRISAGILSPTGKIE
jgi:hypothetical protein